MSVAISLRGLDGTRPNTFEARPQPHWRSDLRRVSADRLAHRSRSCQGSRDCRSDRCRTQKSRVVPGPAPSANGTSSSDTHPFPAVRPSPPHRPTRRGPQHTRAQRCGPSAAVSQRGRPQRSGPQRRSPQRGRPQRSGPQRRSPQRSGPQRRCPPARPSRAQRSPAPAAPQRSGASEAMPAQHGTLTPVP
jgi:hypothetical protein